MNSPKEDTIAVETPSYRLDDQVGFLLRQAGQRHASIFTAAFANEVTSTQWAALSKLHQCGALSQNRLGRMTVMDAATIKGVIDRLSQRGLTMTSPDPDDGRRLIVALTAEGRRLVERLIPTALQATEDTLKPLSSREQAQFMALLAKLT